MQDGFTALTRILVARKGSPGFDLAVARLADFRGVGAVGGACRVCLNARKRK